MSRSPRVQSAVPFTFIRSELGIHIFKTPHGYLRQFNYAKGLPFATGNYLGAEFIYKVSPEIATARSRLNTLYY